MRTSSASPVALLLAVVAAAGLLLIRAAAEAEATTIEGTCRAAAARDRRVDVPFCVAQFAAYHGAAEAADAWGLARTAALVGVNLSDDAGYDIGDGKVGPPPASGARGRAAVAACAECYDAAGTAFAEAADALGARRYAAAREKMAAAAALARRCDEGFVAVGTRTPPVLARYSAECRKMAVIGIAITNLIR